MTASLLLGTAIAGLRIAAPSVGQVVSPQDGAILRFVDCKTQQKVVLVGSMHYNPRSIQLAAEAVRAEAEAGTLRSVVVESCPTRWNNTMKNQPKGTFLRSLFDNEMQAAAEVAEECGCPVALGDQAIEDTARRMAQLTGATMVEVLTPFSGAFNYDLSPLGATNPFCPSSFVSTTYCVMLRFSWDLNIPRWLESHR